MSSVMVLAAEAHGLTKAAKSAEEAGNIDQMRPLYLQAAGKFDEVSALTSDKIEKSTQSGLAEHFYGHPLLFVGKAGISGRIYKVAVVPKDIRKGFEELLKGG